MTDDRSIRFHGDTALFGEALRYTSSQTGFIARLVEKDYFCSVVLQHLSETAPTLVFRGGTCLAKIHSGFYRLSEDLDYLLPTPAGSLRSQRRRLIAETKEALEGATGLPNGLQISTPLTGANQSTQYSALLRYRSILGDQEETIKVEVGLREETLEPPVTCPTHTLLQNPITGSAAVPPFSVVCLSQREAMAEKFRAALSRREAAIRDFFDIDYAIRKQLVDVDDRAFLSLVEQKLSIPGNSPVDVSPARLDVLSGQLRTQLYPVLRREDFEDFDLERAFETVACVADAIP